MESSNVLNNVNMNFFVTDLVESGLLDSMINDCLESCVLDENTCLSLMEELDHSLRANKFISHIEECLQKCVVLSKKIHRILYKNGFKYISQYIHPQIAGCYDSSRPKKHPCRECGKAFRSPNELRRHRVIHSKEKPFRCELCEYACNRKCNLNRHVRWKHSDNRPEKHPCRECGKAFLTTNELRRHCLIHSMEKPIVCEFCEFTCMWKCTLDRHLNKMHPDRTPSEYHCDQCVAVFWSMKLLKNHMIVHAKNCFSCVYCGKNFTKKILCDSHMVNVHQDKSLPHHECEICKKVFNSTSHLQVHLLVHSAEKKFSCRQCPTRFKEKGSLFRHIRNIHGGDRTADGSESRITELYLVEERKRTAAEGENEGTMRRKVMDPVEDEAYSSWRQGSASENEPVDDPLQLDYSCYSEDEKYDSNVECALNSEYCIQMEQDLDKHIQSYYSYYNERFNYIGSDHTSALNSEYGMKMEPGLDHIEIKDEPLQEKND